ncbi:hypothetical protein [Granulicella tundricola]|uniref:hypothetical protein n=1 Tax=Granulicella tundricola TaxID=940615 RepID=UPI0001DB7FDD|nr:hypothetical protein [Granulicella tundricola]
MKSFLSGSNESLALKAFTNLAKALAPHVNRKAIIARSPEARLTRRLFDADKVVKVFLPNFAGQFYLSTQDTWEWNSRYWEQRALFTADDDLSTGLQYARHAVAIENHPFALTTLGKLLLRRMESAPMERDAAFNEAFQKLSRAIDDEEERARITVHPFLTVFAGTSRFLELNGTLSAKQRAALQGYLLQAPTRFRGDPGIQATCQRLDEQINWS